MTLKKFYSIIELKIHRKFRACLHRILKVNSRTTGIKKKKLVARLVKWRGEILVELFNITALATEVFVPVSEMTILKVLEITFLNHELSVPFSCSGQVLEALVFVE